MEEEREEAAELLTGGRLYTVPLGETEKSSLQKNAVRLGKAGNRAFGADTVAGKTSEEVMKEAQEETLGEAECLKAAAVETVGEGAAKLYARLSAEETAVRRAVGTEERKQSTVGNVAETVLEQAAQADLRENGMGGTVKLHPGWEWSALKAHAGHERDVERLYGQVNAAWLRESASGERGVVVSVSEGAAGGGMSLREMDRAFQRDARRYDGGLSLL